ncbi:MAG: serine/threonine protein kinase [Anaerolineae bacterium]|nr:serine/threonine protein kinase [Anaerolineae bacterium]
MTLSVGQVVDNRYRIVKLLGHGGFGAVYQAWDARLERLCALKENLDPSSEVERQFGKEATILANLNHPNLPRVIDHFTVAGQGQYLVMDFVEGDDLQQMLDRRGPLPEAEVLPWITQICDALAYLHNQPQPIIHRDIKPANVKITSDGQPMLVDFGIAKFYDPARQTTLGARAITPGYSPPEQYGHGRTDTRSDIYSLGATLYALLTGKEPADSVERLIGAAALTPPEQLNPLISEPVARVIMKAMAAEPAQRFQSIAEFKAALVSDSPARSTVTPVGQSTRAVDHRAVAHAVGVAQPEVMLPPRLGQGRRTPRILAVITLALGVLSWILVCVQPVALMGLGADQVLGSAAAGMMVILGFCGGGLSALVALVIGLLVLLKYRKKATGGDYAMVAVGVVAAAILVLSAIGLVVFALLLPAAGT